MPGRLHDKVCIITGSGGAIGRASCLAFAREGARVVGCDVNAQAGQDTLEAVRTAGGDMTSLHPCNLVDPEECSRLIDHTLGHYGRLDVLFNNAGKLHGGWITDDSTDHWYRTIDEELNITFLLSRAAWRALGETAGTIVNTASAAAWTTFKVLPGMAHSAAKAGIVALTRHLALEGRKLGIRANSISPGPIGTPTVLRLAEDKAWDEAMRGRMMNGKYGTPEEVAAVALFLASDESSLVNAADIAADGGALSW